ncbi:L-Ala-D/L-amino acid epimerase isoform X3 [Lotus japonicus]|uniref:L-Ala-D/L-amino acid epimerase isoform X2 n=1 Tax=Lotus japonicus TaxID=34305 RepID=UPI00258259E9|nr:L-Ala-D/L-amino acid epimerase isoform X2 [Lotus japonicus]XP_057417344.1 L-Ala-D/L-amino acid epimerase isoform X3 [Lotus japonicus]
MFQTLTCYTTLHSSPMDSTSFLSSAPTLFTSTTHNSISITPTFSFPRNSLPFTKIMASSATTSSTAQPIVFGFKTLMETFTVDVHRAENRPLNVPLIAPFTIASSRLDKVENVAIRVELKNGAVGWGEAPVLPFVTAEDQPTAMAKASEACAFLYKCPALTLGSLLGEIGAILPGHQFASVRAGVEMAIIDAVANSIRVPLWKLFGGASNTITTDITIPIVSPSEAAKLASKYYKEGFETLKLKVGKNLNADIEVLQAIRAAHPTCQFILDANEGYNSEEAVEVLEKLHEMGLTPVLFEQPVHRDDWDGLGYVSSIARERYGVSVAADESCRGLTDVYKIAEGNLLDVINIKLAKVGVMGALDIIDKAKVAGLDLMIGGMVETRLAMGFAGHLAAGLGCFKFIDLDTPLLLADDPVLEGYEVSGATYKFTNARGHGGFLHWDNVA